MKTPSEDLYKLIESLNQHEKRFFSIHSKRYKENPKIITFYNLILANKSLEEDVLSKQLKIKKQELKYYKRDLYKSLIKSLDLFYLTQNKPHEILSTINHIKILINKGLFDQAKKLARDAKKICKEFEIYDSLILLDVLDAKIIINARTGAEDLLSIKQVNKESSDNLSVLTLALTYEKLKNEILLFTKKNKFANNSDLIALIEGYFEHELIKKHPLTESKKILINYYYINYLLYSSIDYWAKAQLNIEKAIKTIESGGLLFIEDSEYLNYLLDLAKSYIHNNDKVNVLSLFKKVKKYIANLPEKQLNELIKTLSLSFEKLEIEFLYNKADEYDTFVQKIYNLKNTADFMYMRIEEQKELQFLLIKHLFHQKRLKETVKEINVYENNYLKINIFEDYNEHFVIIKLIIHYELGNFEVIESMVRSYLRQNNISKNSEYLNLVLNTFKKEKYFNDEPLINKKRIRSFLEVIQKYNLKRHNYIDETKYFDLENWLKEKAKSTS